MTRVLCHCPLAAVAVSVMALGRHRVFWLIANARARQNPSTRKQTLLLRALPQHVPRAHALSTEVRAAKGATLVTSK